MTREEAIKILEEYPCSTGEVDGDTCAVVFDAGLDDVEVALGMAIAALREQPQWISVEDALPVINDNEPLEEFATDRGYTFIVSDGKYVWTELFLLKANKFDDESVTHWMPLPSAQKEAT